MDKKIDSMTIEDFNSHLIKLSLEGFSYKKTYFCTKVIQNETVSLSFILAIHF